MPLPTSGIISFGDFETEFNSTQPLSMGQMYRNTGPYVEDIIVQTGTEITYTYGDWDPSSGYFESGPLSSGGALYYWRLYVDSAGEISFIGSNLVWNSVTILSSSNSTIRAPDGFQYEAGPAYFTDYVSGDFSGNYYVYRGVRRRPYTENTNPVFTNLNGNVPEFGLIRMSNLRGARDSF